MIVRCAGPTGRIKGAMELTTRRDQGTYPTVVQNINTGQFRFQNVSFSSNISWVTITIRNKLNRKKKETKTHPYPALHLHKLASHLSVYTTHPNQIDVWPLGSYGNNNASSPPQIIIAPAR